MFNLPITHRPGLTVSKVRTVRTEGWGCGTKGQRQRCGFAAGRMFFTRWTRESRDTRTVNRALGTGERHERKEEGGEDRRQTDVTQTSRPREKSVRRSGPRWIKARPVVLFTAGYTYRAFYTGARLKNRCPWHVPAFLLLFFTKQLPSVQIFNLLCGLCENFNFNLHTCRSQTKVLNSTS